VEERLAAAVEAFAEAPVFEEFRRAGTASGSLVEVHLRVRGLPCKVEGRIDLAFAATDHVGIVDWKLGSRDGAGDESLQLAVYGLWACERFSIEVSRLRAWRAFLGNPMVDSCHVSDRFLAAGRARVVQDAMRMVVLHQYGRRGVVEAFSPCPTRKVCAACPFLKACPAGRSCTDD
jgi:hypothetical protein